MVCELITGSLKGSAERKTALVYFVRNGYLTTKHLHRMNQGIVR